MTSGEFLQQLEQNLACLQTEERENAMTYYREYLEEAGAEHEAEALEHLGSPSSVAKRIISEIGDNRSEEPSVAYQPPKYVYPPVGGSVAPPASQSSGRVVFAIVVIVLAFPIWISLAAVWFSLVVSLGAALIAIAAAGVGAPMQGITELMEGMPGYGIYDIGAGLLCIGSFLLLLKPYQWFVAKSTSLLRKLFSGCWAMLTGKGD